MGAPSPIQRRKADSEERKITVLGLRDGTGLLAGAAALFREEAWGISADPPLCGVNHYRACARLIECSAFGPWQAAQLSPILVVFAKA